MSSGSNESPMLPGLHPLAIGDTVLMRSNQTLWGVDFNSGKRIWEVPLDGPTNQAMPGPYGADNEQNPTPPGRRTCREILRALRDSTYGTLSSDGRYVFSLEDVVHPASPPGMRFGRGPFGRGARSHGRRAPCSAGSL